MQIKCSILDIYHILALMKSARGILWLGIGCVVVGLILTYILVKDYRAANALHFDIPKLGSSISTGSAIQDLGTVLGGTVGLLFSLASVFFFTYSLVQTQAEARQTRELAQADARQSRELISSQLAQSTFFNLVKSQRELFLLKNYAKDIQDLSTHLNSYARYCVMGHFESFNLTLFDPASLYTSQFRGLQVLAESILNIINFVTNDLENNEFYHRTFYLGLGEEEKFLVGFVIENELERGTGNMPRLYTERYRETSSFINRNVSTHFPPIKFEGMKFPMLVLSKTELLSFKETIQTKTKFKLEGIESEGLTLKKIHFKVGYMTATHFTEAINVDGVFSFDAPKDNINLYNVFDFLYAQQIIPKAATITMYFNFVFDYNGSNFTVGWIPATFVLSEVGEEHKHGWDEEIQKLMGQYGHSLYYLFIT